MFNTLTSINWLSVLLAFLAFFMLAALWYTVLFPRLYRVSLGKENEPAAEKPAPLFIIGPAVCSLVMTATCAVLLYALHIDTYGAALGFGALVGTGLLFANTVNIAINPNIPRPFLYGLITGSNQVLGMIMVSLLLVAMK